MKSRTYGATGLRLAALVTLFAITTGQASTTGCEQIAPAPAPAPTPGGEPAPHTPANPAPTPAPPPPAGDFRPEANVVKGTVRTVDGRPIAGATIKIRGNTGVMRSQVIEAVTDRNGVYRATVPLGHYNVDGFLDLTYAGEEYKELWLDRTDGDCERRMSDVGIVRHFVFRLSGLAQCINNPDPNSENSYYGAYIRAYSTMFPADAVITFTLTPLGPLADGSTGRTLTMTRTGAALVRYSGRIGDTQALHDIPLGRYRLTATVRNGNGSPQPVWLTRNDGSGAAGEAIEIDFPARRMFPYGIRAAEIGLSPSTRSSSGGAATGGGSATPPPPAPTPAPAPAPSGGGGGGGLPVGNYACSYVSQYAGEMPTGSSVTILDGGNYRAPDGRSGTYSYDQRSATARWITGPFTERSVSAQVFRRADGAIAIRVAPSGGGEPSDTLTCVLR